MGRQAKLKKLRHSSEPATSQVQPDSAPDPTEFVKHLEHQGYSLQEIMHSPELPQEKKKPQI